MIGIGGGRLRGGLERSIRESMVEVMVQNDFPIFGDSCLRKSLARRRIERRHGIFKRSVSTQNIQPSHQRLWSFINLQLNRKLICFAFVVINYSGRDLYLVKTVVAVGILFEKADVSV